MGLNIDRLAEKFKQALLNEQSEKEDANTSVDRLSLALAKAVVEEIQEVKITYKSGLVAPNGAVTGNFMHEIS